MDQTARWSTNMLSQNLRGIWTWIKGGDWKLGTWAGTGNHYSSRATAKPIIYQRNWYDAKNQSPRRNWTQARVAPGGFGIITCNYSRIRLDQAFLRMRPLPFRLFLSSITLSSTLVVDHYSDEIRFFYLWQWGMLCHGSQSRWVGICKYVFLKCNRLHMDISSVSQDPALLEHNFLLALLF